jgi:hypothetical protein
MMVYLLLRDGVVLVRGKRTNIQKAVVADNGTFLVFHCTESLSDVLTVFDSNGRELKQMKLVGVGYPFLNLQKGVASLEIPADSASGTPGRFIFSLLDGSVEVVEPEGECGHCGKLKSRRMLTACESCEEIICPDCKARGCDGPKPPPEPRDAIQCCSRASDAMLGQKLPLEKDVAERVVQFCDRALKFGFAAHHRDIEARAHRMRGEALESLSQHGQALKEYELAFEKDPKVGVKQRIASLRKRCGQSQGESANGGAT